MLTLWEHLYLYGGVPSGVCDHHSGKLLSGVLNMNDRPIPDLKRAVQKMRHLLRYYVVSQLLREPEFIKNEPATMNNARRHAHRNGLETIGWDVLRRGDEVGHQTLSHDSNSTSRYHANTRVFFLWGVFSFFFIYLNRLFPEMVEHLSLFQTAVRKARASEDEVGVEAPVGYTLQRPCARSADGDADNLPSITC